MLTLNKELSGHILDIGGGGEGVIGRLYQSQVTAIDHRQEELDEAPGGFEKMRMDATDLQFPTLSFEHVTFFFTLMFMDADVQEKAIKEAARVLIPGGLLHIWKEAARVLIPGGLLHIWDCDIQSAYPEPFCISLEIQLPSEHISTTYGVGKLGTQNESSISGLCVEAELIPVKHQSGPDGFHMVWQKP